MLKRYTRLLLFLCIGPLSAQHVSKLWGRDGELWNPGKPLQDFSNVAGYHQGLAPLPRWPVRLNIKDFGAKGDGIADDTQALVEAIKACPSKAAVFLPVGKYRITDWIKLRGLKNVIIRGEDMFETELVFAKGLEDLHPSPSRTTSGLDTTRYSWAGGFLWFESAEEVGIENLSFIFPSVTYPDHFNERGYNMISLSGKNCWVRNVRGYNADSGIFISGSYMTLYNILLDAFSDRTRTDERARAGHHAIDIQGGKHNLVEKYTETVKYIHSLGSEGDAQWNVWHRCKGPDIEIDHHTSRARIEHNLYTDIDMGRGQGAEGQRRIDTGMFETFWNLRSTEVIPLDPTGAGIRQGIPIFPDDINYIVVGWNLGWPASEKRKRSLSLPWYEYIGDFDDIYPPNIYIAQLKKRLKVDNLPPELMITRPLTGTKFPKGTEVTITAMADDRDGSLAEVELLANGSSMGKLIKFPYQWKFKDKEGTFRIEVQAKDDMGAITKDAVTIRIGDSSVAN